MVVDIRFRDLVVLWCHMRTIDSGDFLLAIDNQSGNNSVLTTLDEALRAIDEVNHLDTTRGSIISGAAEVNKIKHV